VRFTWPFGGLPIGGVYLGQAGGPWLGTARLGGPLLLTAVVWAGGAGVATAAAGMRQAAGRTGGRTGGRRLVVGGRRVVVGGLALLVGLGALAVIGGAAPDGGPAVRTIAVASVQGGGRRGLSKEQVDPATVYAAQLDATAADAGRARSSRVSLVVWPEDTVALGQPLVGSPQAAALSALARRWRVTLLAGVTVTLPWPSHTFRNEVVAWGPDGRIVGVFEKVHRVPFGEYVPDRAFFSHLANLSGVPLDAVPGHGSGLLRTPAGPLGLMVSYEVFYAARGRSSVRAGAQLLVVPTNTSSYATSQVPTQEVAAARVQAVSEGRDLVQAAPTGFSALVDHRGRVLERSSLGARQVLLGTVALRDGSTFYERTGDLPVLVLAMVAVAAGWLAEARRNRGRRPAGRPRAEGPAPAHS